MYELIWIFLSLLVVSIGIILARKWGEGVLMALVVFCIVTANIFASKIIRMFGFTVPAGVVVYAISFLITDTLSEFYGRRIAVRAVLTGFFGSLVYFAFVMVVINWENAFGPEADAAFHETLRLSARITAASIVAYLVSQLHDVTIFDFWGRLTRGKHLWLRNNASTIVSQSLDTVIFVAVAFYGTMPIWPLIGGQLVVKAIVALFDTPFLYFLKYRVFTGEEYKVFNVSR
jgi:queuosine precursor transporter